MGLQSGIPSQLSGWAASGRVDWIFAGTERWYYDSEGCSRIYVEGAAANTTSWRVP